MYLNKTSDGFADEHVEQDEDAETSRKLGQEATAKKPNTAPPIAMQ